MKNIIKPLLFAAATLGSFSANAYTDLDQLGLAQINPQLAPALATRGSIVNFYGENYVVTDPTVCTGPSFNLNCQFNIMHLSADPSITVHINQIVSGDNAVMLITAKPDGKTFHVSYNQQLNGTALNVLNIRRIDRCA